MDGKIVITFPFSGEMNIHNCTNKVHLITENTQDDGHEREHTLGYGASLVFKCTSEISISEVL